MEDNPGEDISLNSMQCVTEKAFCDIGVCMVLPRIIAINVIFSFRFIRNLPLSKSGCIRNNV